MRLPGDSEAEAKAGWSSPTRCRLPVRLPSWPNSHPGTV